MDRTTSRLLRLIQQGTEQAVFQLLLSKAVVEQARWHTQLLTTEILSVLLLLSQLLPQLRQQHPQTHLFQPLVFQRVQAQLMSHTL